MNVKRIKFLIVGTVLFSAFLYLFLTSFKSENLAYFRTVDEIAAMGQELYGRGIRVEGKLVPNSLKRNPEAMKLAFRIQGEKSTLPVRFIGVPPDLLENGFPVIAEGKINRQGVLVAKNLMVACQCRRSIQAAAIFNTTRSFTLATNEPSCAIHLPAAMPRCSPSIIAGFSPVATTGVKPLYLFL